MGALGSISKQKTKERKKGIYLISRKQQYHHHR
jgi:hypothetical protein